MRCIGVDLAWTDRRASGLVVLDEAGRVEASAWRTDLEDIAAFCIAQARGEPALVAVDAPLWVPNETGHRPVDRELMRLFGGRRLGVHAASRRRLLEAYGGLRGPALARRLGERGLEVMEVYPHAALVAWFDLPAPLPYKRGPVRRRLQGMRRLVRLLESLEQEDPPLRVGSAPWAAAVQAPGVTASELEQLEGLLDALVCAHTAAFWRRWGTGRCARLGDGQGPWLVVPLPPGGPRPGPQPPARRVRSSGRCPGGGSGPERTVR